MEEQMMFGFGPLARSLGVSRDTLVRAANKGELATVYICGRRMVPRAEVQRVQREGIGRRKNATIRDAQG